MTITNGIRPIATVPTNPRALATDPRFVDPETREGLYPPLRDRLSKLEADALWLDAHTAAGFETTP